MVPTSGPFAKLLRRHADAPPMAVESSPVSEEIGRLIGALQIVLQGTQPDDGLVPALKGFIADEQGKIVGMHRQGGSGREVVRAITELTDAVVTSIYRLADAACDPHLKARAEGCALIALGGYRSEERRVGKECRL